jgi:hypothetical protein
MAGLVPGIQDLGGAIQSGGAAEPVRLDSVFMDGRDKPGHDGF